MENKRTGLIVIVVAIVAIAGGAITLGKSGSNKESLNQEVESQDDGTVAGVSNDDGEFQDGEYGEYKEKLAKFLTEKGAVLYGAYWCPHCKDQKKLFGEAVKYVNSVECDANGEDANPDECRAQNIESYPTWVYQGKKYSGTKSLAELAEIVGFSDESASDISDQPGVAPVIPGSDAAIQ